jgi:hypothetical protein
MNLLDIIINSGQHKGMLKFGFWVVFLVSLNNPGHGFLIAVVTSIIVLSGTLLNFLIPGLREYLTFLDKFRILSYLALFSGGIVNVTFTVLKECWIWLS